MMTTIDIRIDEKLKRGLQRKCRESGISVSTWARLMAQRAIESKEPIFRVNL